MNAHSNRADFEAARRKLDRLESFLGHDPDNSMLQADAFRVALECGEWERADAVLRRAQAAQPGDPAWALREADFLLAQQRYPEAKALLERLASLAEPGSAFGKVVIQNLAFIDFRQADYAACVARLEPFTSAPSDAVVGGINGSLQQLWLRALHRHGEIARACEWTAAAEQAGLLDPAAAGVASLAAIDAEDFASAERWAKLALVSPPPPSIEVLITRASLALAARDPGGAREFADRALALNREDGRAWSARAFANMLQGDLDAAQQDFGQALTFMPGHIGTWHGQGWAQVLRRDLAAARRSFQTALELDRNFAESHGALAVVFALQQQGQAAREHVELAKRLDVEGLAARYAEAILSGEAQDGQAVQRLARRLLGGRKAPLGGAMRDWLTSNARDPKQN
jgi:tetratricopeptide (TPR) repeat protein